MRQDHSGSTFWECLACSSSETTEIFPEVEEFRAHTKLVHADAITEEQFLVMERVCAQTNPASIEACPLCVHKDHDEMPTDPETLLNHIGDHIHDFSLLSLPWADSSEEVDSAIIAAATKKAMEWDFILPLCMENTILPLLEPQQLRTPTLESRFAVTEYFAESSDGSSRAISSSERDLSVSEVSSLPSTGEAEDDEGDDGDESNEDDDDDEVMK